MSGTLDGKVAVVTGAGQGLGLAYARALARAGAAVVVNDANPDTAAAAAASIVAAGGRAVAVGAAVGPAEVADLLVRTAVSELGRLGGAFDLERDAPVRLHPARDVVEGRERRRRADP